MFLDSKYLLLSSDPLLLDFMFPLVVVSILALFHFNNFSMNSEVLDYFNFNHLLQFQSEDLASDT